MQLFCLLACTNLKENQFIKYGKKDDGRSIFNTIFARNRFLEIYTWWDSITLVRGGKTGHEIICNQYERLLTCGTAHYKMLLSLVQIWLLMNSYQCFEVDVLSVNTFNQSHGSTESNSEWLPTVKQAMHWNWTFTKIKNPAKKELPTWELLLH